MNSNLVNENVERKNTKRNGIILGVIGGALVLGGILGSYAFFQAVGSGNKNEEVSVQTGNLSLIFADGNKGFSQALEFGHSAEKTFTIQNDGTLDAVAKINWKNITNNYLEGSLTYTLSYSETEAGDYTEIVKDENVPRSETPTTVELANGLEIPAGVTYYYKLIITLNYTDFDQTTDLKATLNTEFSIEEGQVGKNLVQTLLAKANPVSVTDYNTGVKAEMFTFEHDATEQTEALTDYRYIGSTPNNYINFNDETWRIIGVFTAENEAGIKEQRIKIIREASIGDLAWDSGNVNEWPTSSLSTLLNTGDYYNRTGTYSTNGLTDTAKSQIAPVKWYLGGSSEYKNLGGPDYYNFERGTTTCVTTGECSGKTRSTNWIANVGLMYPSDYVYTYSNGVDNTCYTDGSNCSKGTPNASWLYNSLSTTWEWTISPFAEMNYNVFMRHTDGFVSSGFGSNYAYGTVYLGLASRPVVYLRCDIQITGGDGSSAESAYQIK